MNERPQTWHYGLVARWWAEFNTDGPEIEYFRRFIERFGEPALDVACGAGRLLVSYRRAGLDVDGADISADMVRLAGERLAAEGLEAGLFVQAMHELDPPRRYRTILVCGGFALGGSRTHDQEALRRFHSLLLPGGALVIDYYLPYKDADEWRYWPNEERAELPEPWPEEGLRKRAADGDEIELLIRLAALDPLEQVATREIRARLWRDGRVVEEERHVLLERLYFRNELLDMLALAGFEDVEVLGDHTEDAATAESGVLVFVARRTGVV
jgi:SAM-dependent methyltransferase